MRVLEDHNSDFAYFIQFEKGTKVVITDKQTRFDNWTWCIIGDKGAWVPNDYLSIYENDVVVNQYYSSRELDLKEGDIVSYIKNISDWTFVRTVNGIEGWIPSSKLRKA